MKRTVILLSILGIVGLIFLQIGNMTIMASDGSPNKNRNELVTIATILEKENVSVQEWSAHSREHLTSIRKKEDLKQFQAKLMKEFPTWDWSIHQNNGNWEAIATNTSNDYYTETIKMMATLTNDQVHTYLLYEVKGSKWNKQTNEFFNKKWNSRLSNIFRGNPTNFSCMKADISDKIVKSLTSTSDQWLKAFNAKEIESLKETEFVSISAASPLFAETIQTKNEKMNLQIAIRSNGLGAKTTLVVGTPIITIEY
jgi:hypothetical protein